MVRQVAAYAFIVAVAVVLGILWRELERRTRSWKPLRRCGWALVFIVFSVIVANMVGWLVSPWLVPN